MLQRVEQLGQRWPWLGLVLDVQRRFSDLNGGYVAGAVTLALFLSLFPLILVSIAVLGFFSSSDASLADDIIARLGLTGTAADQLEQAVATAEDSTGFASSLGLAGLLWAGLGVVAAFQYAIDTVWQVKGRGLKDKLYALAWLVGTAVLFAGSFVLSALLKVLPGPITPVAFVVGLAVQVALFWWTFQVLGSRDVGWRPLLPGALTAGIGFQALTVLGAVYVPGAVASSSALYGSIGVVFAVLAWLFFFGRLLVYAAALNVVLFERARGTVTIDIEVPRLPGEVAIEANRSGAVVNRATTD